jgi:hypothetical protein
MKRPAAGGGRRGPGRGRRAPDARPHRPPTPRHRNGPPPRRDGNDHGARRGVRRRPGRATARAARLPRPHGHTEASWLRHRGLGRASSSIRPKGWLSAVPWTSTKRPSPVQTAFMPVSALTSSSSSSSGRSTPPTMPTLTTATVLVSGWASDPAVPRTIEASAADAPAALKAIGTTAPAKARAVVPGRGMGQPRIAVVSRVNWRWPISV